MSWSSGKSLVEAGAKVATGMTRQRLVKEPFRMKAVEPLRLTTQEEREELLRQAHYNPFRLRSQDVLVDLLTDSGTGAMSARQWGAMIAADESFAGSPAQTHFTEAIHTLMPNLNFVHPVHQGRGAERIIARLFGGPGTIFPNNSHFDTTRANFEYTGATALDLPVPEAFDSAATHPFKGNMDLEALRRLLRTEAARVPFVTLTVTNNTLGGQPVSMTNIRQVSDIANHYNKPLFLDSCRFAENAYFIKQREPGYADKQIVDIVREMFSHCNGAWNSAKKDGMANTGGFLALEDRLVNEVRKLKRELAIETAASGSLGGLTGRDLEAMSLGYFEAMDEDYLAYRVGSMEFLGAELHALGVPIVRPVGGHAVFIDAARFLPHIPPLQFPGVALANALYLEAGVRAVEIGSLMFGAQPDGSEKPAGMELTRLAFPRRVYMGAHHSLVVQALACVLENRSALTGYSITRQLPRLRHFSAHLRPLHNYLPRSHCHNGLYV